MTFISLNFILFFLATYSLFYLAYKSGYQNVVLLLASYFFYGYWDYRCLSLIVFISLTSYFAAQLFKRPGENSNKKLTLTISIVLLLLPITIFKYYNFFFSTFLDTFGQQAFFNLQTMQLILPIGISFYTFQAIAYVVDAYKDHEIIEDNIINFLSFMAFFPQLVAGPIERAGDLLRQFQEEKAISADNLTSGLAIVLYGCIMKICVADVVAPYVSLAFSFETSSGVTFILGTLLFGLQIYGDFLGYSLIAKGVAKTLGFTLVWNFNRPYLSTSIIDFWRNWHMSLSRWLRDYIYIPLGGNRCAYPRQALNILITMAIAGLWHGAAYNFVLWGVWLGLWLVIWHGCTRRLGITIPKAVGWPLTFCIVMIGWSLFRSESIAQFVHLVSLVTGDLTYLPVHREMLQLLLLFPVLLFFEAKQTRPDDWLVLERLSLKKKAIAVSMCILVVLMTLDRAQEQFIYFQF